MQKFKGQDYQYILAKKILTEDGTSTNQMTESGTGAVQIMTEDIEDVKSQLDQSDEALNRLKANKGSKEQDLSDMSFADLVDEYTEPVDDKNITESVELLPETKAKKVHTRKRAVSLDSLRSKARERESHVLKLNDDLSAAQSTISELQNGYVSKDVLKEKEDLIIALRQNLENVTQSGKQLKETLNGKVQELESLLASEKENSGKSNQGQESLRRELEETKGKLEKTNNELSALRVSFQTYIENLQTSKVTIDELDETISRMRDKLASHQDEIEKLSNLSSDASVKIEKYKRVIERQSAMIAKAARTLQVLDEEKNKVVADATSEISRLSERNAQLVEAVEAQNDASRRIKSRGTAGQTSATPVSFSRIKSFQESAKRREEERRLQKEQEAREDTESYFQRELLHQAKKFEQDEIRRLNEGLKTKKTKAERLDFCNHQLDEYKKEHFYFSLFENEVKKAVSKKLNKRQIGIAKEVFSQVVDTLKEKITYKLDAINAEAEDTVFLPHLGMPTPDVTAPDEPGFSSKALSRDIETDEFGDLSTTDFSGIFEEQDEDLQGDDSPVTTPTLTADTTEDFERKVSIQKKILKGGKVKGFFRWMFGQKINETELDTKAREMVRKAMIDRGDGFSPRSRYDKYRDSVESNMFDSRIDYANKHGYSATNIIENEQKHQAQSRLEESFNIDNKIKKIGESYDNAEKANLAKEQIEKLLDEYLNDDTNRNLFDSLKNSTNKNERRTFINTIVGTNGTDGTVSLDSVPDFTQCNMLVGNDLLKGARAPKNKYDLFKAIIIERLYGTVEKDNKAAQDSKTIWNRIGTNIKSAIAGASNVATLGAVQVLMNKYERFGTWVEGKEGRDTRVLRAQMKLLERNVRNVNRTAQFWSKYHTNYDRLSTFEKAQYNTVYAAMAGIGFATMSPILGPLGIAKSSLLKLGAFSVGQAALPAAVRYSSTLDKELFKGAGNKAYTTALWQSLSQFVISVGTGATITPLVSSITEAFLGLNQSVSGPNKNQYTAASLLSTKPAMSGGQVLTEETLNKNIINSLIATKQVERLSPQMWNNLTKEQFQVIDQKEFRKLALSKESLKVLLENLKTKGMTTWFGSYSFNNGQYERSALQALLDNAVPDRNPIKQEELLQSAGLKFSESSLKINGEIYRNIVPNLDGAPSKVITTSLNQMYPYDIKTVRPETFTKIDKTDVKDLGPVTIKALTPKQFETLVTTVVPKLKTEDAEIVTHFKDKLTPEKFNIVTNAIQDKDLRAKFVPNSSPAPAPIPDKGPVQIPTKNPGVQVPLETNNKPQFINAPLEISITRNGGAEGPMVEILMKLKVNGNTINDYQARNMVRNIVTFTPQKFLETIDANAKAQGVKVSTGFTRMLNDLKAGRYYNQAQLDSFYRVHLPKVKLSQQNIMDLVNGKVTIRRFNPSTLRLERMNDTIINLGAKLKK